MTSVKDIRNWTPEDRNEIRLLIRKLNGIIDSLNYKYFQYNSINRRIAEINYSRQQTIKELNDLQNKEKSHLLEINKQKSLLNAPLSLLNKLFRETKNISKSNSLANKVDFYFFVRSLRKKAKNEIEPHENELKYIQEDIQKKLVHIRYIDTKIEILKEKSSKIKKAYKKQLLQEYNNLVTRLNLMSGYQGNPIVRIEPPNTFYQLFPIGYWKFHVTKEMEEVTNE